MASKSIWFRLLYGKHVLVGCGLERLGHYATQLLTNPLLVRVWVSQDHKTERKQSFSDSGSK